MLSDLKKVKDTKGIILRAIVLVSVAITRRLALVKSLVILLKGLRLNLVALGFIIIEFISSSCLGGCCFRVILIIGDYYSALSTI